MVSDDIIGVMWTVALTAVLCGLVAWPLIRAARGAGRVLATRGEVAEAPRATGRAHPGGALAYPVGTRVVSRVSGTHGAVIAVRWDWQEYIVFGDDGETFASEPENLMRESVVAGGDVLWMHELAKSRRVYRRTRRAVWPTRCVKAGSGSIQSALMRWCPAAMGTRGPSTPGTSGSRAVGDPS